MSEKAYLARFIIYGCIYSIELDSRNQFGFFDHYPLFVDGVMKIPLVSGSLAGKVLKAYGIPGSIVNQFKDA